MNDFPAFMKNPANRIAAEAQYTPGIEGYVFDGADGSQMAFWTNTRGGASASHIHDYDEYMVVVQGGYTVHMGGKSVALRPGDELLIPAGTPHGGESAAGTRTIHAFAGKRARRVSQI